MQKIGKVLGKYQKGLKDELKLKFNAFIGNNFIEVINQINRK